MRVLSLAGENHEVDDVDDADAQVVAEVLAEDARRVDDLLGQLVADADEDDVRVDALVDRVVCRKRRRG